MAGTTRATALPPGERRAAIVAATLPLLVEHGAGVTTKQIAEAACIAEGTIFRVFPDKDAVVRAAVELALDPAPTEAALACIDRDLPLDLQLGEAVEIIQARLAYIWRLAEAVGEDKLQEWRDKGPGPDLLALEQIFAAHRDELRRDPTSAARQLRALTLAVSHPALYADGPMSAPEIVSLLLDGIRSRHAAVPPEDEEGPRCSSDC